MLHYDVRTGNDYSAISAHGLLCVQRTLFSVWSSLIGDQHFSLIRLADKGSKQRDVSMGRFCAAFRLYHWLRSMLGAWSQARIVRNGLMCGQGELNCGLNALEQRNNQIPVKNMSCCTLLHSFLAEKNEKPLIFLRFLAFFTPEKEGFEAFFTLPTYRIIRVHSIVCSEMS